MRLNVVFDKWDENNKPIKNLEYLDKIYREFIVIYPFTVHIFSTTDIERGWKLNECKLTDITTDENYY